MTLSNFDWTDKKSIRWFIMLGAGHEGPYSFENLEVLLKNKKITLTSKVWAEGLDSPINFSEVLQKKSDGHVQVELDELPPLPPLPIEELIEVDTQQAEQTKRKSNPLYFVIVSGFLIVFIYLAFNQWIASKEVFSFSRPSKMSVELQQKILDEFKFQGWGREIFFKEFVASDLSQIWLVTSSFQRCEVSASFESLPQKLLTFSEEKVAFDSKGILKDHLVQFDRFDFKSGNRIVPGMYQMNVRASDCSWDGVTPQVANLFNNPATSYSALIKVILYPGGAIEFNQVLSKLLNKKMETEIKEKSKIEDFWLDLQQKLQTLLAISLQVEHLMLDFLDRGESQFIPKLRPMVDEYTKKYGHFLTKFVVANENYFKELKLGSNKAVSQQKNYEMMIRIAAKNIGQESMKLLEEWMNVKKKPSSSQMKAYKEKVKKTYQSLKEDINQKIIQISEDRST
ncbi:MAG: DUF4339 domain-containing protein [Bacteriovoracaceae bacterium]